MSTLNELQELTTVTNDDILLVQDTTLGEDSKATKENFLKEVNASLNTLTSGLDEVESTVASFSEVNKLSGGSGIDLVRVNVFTDSMTYTLPELNTLPENYLITFLLPEADRALTPKLATASGNTITYSGGSDTVIDYNRESWGSVTLFKNTITSWRI